MPIGIPDDLRSPPPEPLEFWTPSITRIICTLQVSNEALFRIAARKYGIDPDKKDAFADWGQGWWARPVMFMKWDSTHLIDHELRHLDPKERRFHD